MVEVWGGNIRLNKNNSKIDMVCLFDLLNPFFEMKIIKASVVY